MARIFSGRKFMGVVLFACDLDPFELYKDATTREQLTHKMGQSRELQLGFTKGDVLRSRLGHFNRLFAYYFLIKFILISVVHYCLLEHEFRHQLSREPLMELKLLLQARSFIGNPYGVLAGFAFLMYIGMSSYLFFLVVIVAQRYYRSKKLDMPCLRFCLKPSLEQARVNSIVQLKLVQLNSLIESNSECRNVESRLYSRLHTRLEAINQRMELHKSCQQLQLEARQLTHLMPEVYSQKWQERLSKYLDTIIILMIITLACLSLIVFGSVGILLYWSHTCAVPPHNAVDTTSNKFTTDDASRSVHANVYCRPFTLADGLCLIDLCYAGVLLAAFEIYTICTCIVHYLSHMRLIETTSAHLELCNDKLMQQIVSLKTSFATRTQHKTSTKISQQQQRWESAERYRLVLDQLVRLLVFEVELHDGLRSLTELSTLFSFHVFAILPLNIIARKFKTNYSQQLNNSIIVFIWALFNVFALICAHSYARYTRLHQHYWSISARLMEIEFLLESSSSAELEGDGLREMSNQHTRLGVALMDHQGPTTLLIIRRIWFKVTKASESNAKNCMVRPCGVTMMFERLIELNFLALLALTITARATE